MLFHLLHTEFSRGVHFKQFSHKVGLRFVNHQLAVFFDVAVHIVRAEYSPFFDSLLMTESHTSRDFSRLVLRH